MPLSNNVRRIVTTVDDKRQGRRPVRRRQSAHRQAPRPSHHSRLLWVTGETPADICGPADRAALAMGKIGISPPAGGSVFRIVEFPPIGPEVDKLDNDHLHHQIGDHAPNARACRRGIPTCTAPAPSTTPSSWTARSTCCSTTVEIHMKAGDVLIQQGTNHAWVNRGKETCRIAFILIDSKEP